MSRDGRGRGVSTARARGPPVSAAAAEPHYRARVSVLRQLLVSALANADR